MINVLFALVFHIVTPTQSTASYPTTGMVSFSIDTIKCTHPMTEREFQDGYTSVKKMTFDDSKLTAAKQILNKHCISVEQIAVITRLFDYNETKIDWMRFAYGKTADKKNYNSLEKEFTDAEYIRQLKDFIKSKQAN